jgi:hypothetical protein
MFISQILWAQKNIYLKFENIANGKKLVLNDSVYTNAFGEKYTVSKLKYYISNVNFQTISERFKKNVYLVDASKNDSIKIKKIADKVFGIYFQIGVDSLLNCSGAQTGALDPLNDMFWTWNNGYVNFKLEGFSPSSNANNKKVEQHIGGYKSPYTTMRKIYLKLPADYFKYRKNITIQLNLDKYWKATNEIRIAEKPVIASAGQMASDASENFSQMFSIKNEN